MYLKPSKSDDANLSASLRVQTSKAEGGTSVKTHVKTTKLFLALGTIAICALTVTFARSGLVNRRTTDADSGGAASVTSPPGANPTPPTTRDSQTSTGTDVAGQNLTGRSLSTDEAVGSADSIIVGRIISLGDSMPGAPGQKYYGDVRIAVLQTIRGDAPDEQEATKSLRVQKFPDRVSEEEPQVGQEYIFFLQRPAPSDMRGIKLLHATGENVNEVTGLVSRVPVP